VEIICSSCKNRRICVYYYEANRIQIPGIFYDFGFQDKILNYARTELPKVCGEFKPQEKVSTITRREKLKLWYPLAKPEETCEFCKCVKSEHIQGIWCKNVRQTMWMRPKPPREECCVGCGYPKSEHTGSGQECPILTWGSWGTK